MLSEENDYGKPFFVLMSLAEVERRTKVNRVQYQVNFRSDMGPAPGRDVGIGPEPWRCGTSP